MCGLRLLGPHLELPVNCWWQTSLSFVSTCYDTRRFRALAMTLARMLRTISRLLTAVIISILHVNAAVETSVNTSMPSVRDSLATV